MCNDDVYHCIPCIAVQMTIPVGKVTKLVLVDGQDITKRCITMFHMPRSTNSPALYVDLLCMGVWMCDDLVIDVQ